jgi:hypothetical protein
MNFQGRINFTRVGWIVFLTFSFFNSQFGLLNFNEPDDIKQNPPQVSKPAARENCAKKTKKPRSEKKPCF